MRKCDVLKFFTTEGGISTRTSRTYVHRSCPYIKVAVKFAPLGAADRFGEGPSDRIVSLSQPFLQYGIID